MSDRQTIPQPKTSGVAKVPVVMQLEMLECGAASLCMILHYYHKWLPLEQVRADCGVSRDGSSAKSIIQVAQSYGLNAQAWKTEPEGLLEDGGPFPCILHWEFNHFVVLCGFRGRKAIINDPARGRVAVPWEEFDQKFTGVCITFEPNASFCPEGKKKSVITYAAQRLKGSKTAVIFVVLTTTISSLLGIISPVFNRVFLDRLLSGKNPEWLRPFMISFCALAFLTIIVAWVARIYSLRIEGKMSATGNSSYLWKILHLPMQFFSQRLAGDISDRQATNASIASVLVNTVAPLALNALMVVFYLFIMLKYSWLLSLIGVGAILLNTAVSALISAKRINIARVQLRDAAKLSGTTVSGISMIETIKSSGAEKGYFGRWAGFQAGVNTQNIKYMRLNSFLGLIPTTITTIANLAVLALGVQLVVRGEFSIGMVMAFQGFLSSFMSPATSLISAGQSLQEMITQMERVDDVMSYPTDTCFNPVEKTEEYHKLSGAIELEHVTFGYSPLGQAQIEDFSLFVKPGQCIAIVGSSGCGKSTLAKLIAGLYKPWSGSICFDGIPIAQIDRNVFAGSVSVIDQDITLFDDSISENIKMWDETVEDFEVVMAARDAGIHDDILSRKGGYQYKLQEGGRNLSGGQRQRLEIARALAQDPTICILDEATSALDAKTEYNVVKSISDRGITCIIIAHRLSTIRDCDEIIVLEKGRVIERGTHTELMAQNGSYSRLVISE